MHTYKWTAFKGTCWEQQQKMLYVCMSKYKCWLDTPPCKSLTFTYIGINSEIRIYVSKSLDWRIKAQSSSFPHFSLPTYSTSVFYFFPSFFTALSLYICFSYSSLFRILLPYGFEM